MTTDDGFVPLFDPEGYHRARRDREYARAVGEYLHRFRWSHYCSLGSSARTGEDRLFFALTEWLDKVDEKAGTVDVKCVWFVERGFAGGNNHIHALIDVPPTVSARQLDRLWGSNQNRIEKYDPARGAAFYVGKFVANGIPMGLSRTMPPVIAGRE